MTARIGFFIAVVVALSFAVGPEASAEEYTLDRIYSLTLEKNEELRIADENVRQAKQERWRAFSFTLPKVTLGGNIKRYSEEKTGSGFSLQPKTSNEMFATIEQPLYSGGKSKAGLRIAKRGVEVARKNMDLATESLLLRVSDLFYGTLKAEKKLEAQQRNMERLREHRRLSELRFKVGEVTESILLRAEAELASAFAELVADENDLAIKKQELQILAGLPDRFRIEEPHLPSLPEETGPSLLDRALLNRNEVARSLLQEDVAEAGVAFARGNFLPSLSVNGSYSKRGQDPQSTFFVEESWYVGGKVEFTIFEGGLRMAEFGQARSQLRQDRLATALLKKEITLDMTQTRLNLEAITRVLESREDQRRFASKNYEMVSKQFTFGLVTNIDLLDANQLLIEAERDVIETTYDRHLAILDLQRAAGTFLSETLKKRKI